MYLLIYRLANRIVIERNYHYLLTLLRKLLNCRTKQIKMFWILLHCRSLSFYHVRIPHTHHFKYLRFKPLEFYTVHSLPPTGLPKSYVSINTRRVACVGCRPCALTHTHTHTHTHVHSSAGLMCSRSHKPQCIYYFYQIFLSIHYFGIIFIIFLS